MAIPHEILKLIERFEQNREAYHSDPYNETQLRREFVDPFFEALGWDVDNKQGYAEAKTDQEKIVLQRQIDSNDHQIDQLVYDLYELTEDEITIIEETTK